MLGGLINGLVVAWILSLFDVNDMLINILQPFIVQITLTDDHYYIIFAIIGLIGGMFGQYK